MCVLILLFAVIFTVVYGSSYYSVRRQNEEMLDRYVSIYSLDALPGEFLPEMPPSGETAPPDDGGFFMLSSFYSEAIADDGSIIAADTGRNGFYSEEQISEMAQEILAQNRTSGRSGHLLYRVDQRDGYTLVAFMDTTLTEDSLKKVLINTLITGAAALLVMLFAAVYLARVIISPLEENDRKQKQFISDAGHELKTPVSVINANADLLAGEIGENEWLSNIRYENDRMGLLVTDLLELSRAENAAWEPEQIDLSRLVMREALPFESVAYEHGLTLNCNAEKDICVRGSSSQLCQLVSILIDNAVSHSNGGNVQVELIRDHRNAVITVRNRGEEIPEDMRDQMFDRFFRMDQARGDNGGHYGLGLSIAKAITDAHKGKISVECSGGDVVFRVSIPVCK